MSSHRFSPDHQILFFSERAGQNTVEYAVYLSEPAKRYTLARFRADDVYTNPGTVMMARGGAAAAWRGAGRRPAAAAVARAAPAAASCSSRPTAAASISRARPTTRSPLEIGPKTFMDKVAIKTGEKKRLYESDNKDVFRAGDERPRPGCRPLHRREGEPDRDRAGRPGGRRDAARR